MVKVKIDREARAIYIRFSNRKVTSTYPVYDLSFTCMVNFDVDKDNELVGVEIILPTFIKLPEDVKKRKER